MYLNSVGLEPNLAERHIEIPNSRSMHPYFGNSHVPICLQIRTPLCKSLGVMLTKILAMAQFKPLNCALLGQRDSAR